MVPNIPEEVRLAAKLMQDRSYDEAAAVLKEYLDHHPKNIMGWYLYSYAAKSRAIKISALEEVVAIDPDYEDARGRLKKFRDAERLEQDVSFDNERVNRLVMLAAIIIAAAIILTFLGIGIAVLIRGFGSRNAGPDAMLLVAASILPLGPPFRGAPPKHAVHKG